MSEIITGALAMGYAVAGLFFLRFWKQSRDRLFAFFSVAFFVLAFQRLALSISVSTASHSEVGGEGHILFYVLRLLAFVLILIAILDKNRVRH